MGICRVIFFVSLVTPTFLFAGSDWILKKQYFPGKTSNPSINCEISDHDVTITKEYQYSLKAPQDSAVTTTRRIPGGVSGDIRAVLTAVQKGKLEQHDGVEGTPSVWYRAAGVKETYLTPEIELKIAGDSFLTNDSPQVAPLIEMIDSLCK